MTPTLLFCTSYFENKAVWEKRYRRWFDYYAKIFPDERLFMIDDGSPYRPQDADIRINDDIENLVLGQKGTIFRFPNRLGRPATLNYPGWFRSFTFSVEIAKRLKLRKIVHIESDAYVLTRKAVDYINGVTAGWTVFWCARHEFPETSLQIICRDSFPALEEVRARRYDPHYVDQRIEELLPYTRVEKTIYGNRYGEFRSVVPGYADFAVQVNEHTIFRSQLV